jgi:hypothetical protein
MEIPKITMTMLGASGSGKTMFLHGMYATLSAGIAGYFVYTRDPDHDIDLMDTWDRLNDEGVLPPPTEEVPTPYDFVLKHGITPLISIDCLDFRGGATDARSTSAADTAQLLNRLRISDTIYLALDGQHVGEWVNNLVPGGRANRARDPMKVARLSMFIQQAAEARMASGKPAPSIVVLITKADVLPAVTGMRKAEALRLAVENMDQIVPVVYSQGITALVCPVQIGNFGIEKHNMVDPTTVDPVGLHRPFIFSLWHFLTEVIQSDEETMRAIADSRSAAHEELSQLKGGFWRELFNGSRISSLSQSLENWDQEKARVDQNIRTARDRAGVLMEQLAKLPILKDGKLQV